MDSFKALSLEALPSNKDGITIIYFQFEDNSYFTLCKKDESSEIYLENGGSGIYTEKIDYKLMEDCILFNLNEYDAKELKADREIKIEFKIINKQFKELEESIEKIFKN
jgi:hypothetical protein